MTNTTSTLPQMGDEVSDQEVLAIVRAAIITDPYKPYALIREIDDGAADEPTGIARRLVKVAMSRVRASLPQPTAGSTGTSKLPEWHLKEREELLVKMDEMTGFWEVAAARELRRLYLIEDEWASTPAQSVLVEALRGKLRELAIVDVHRPAYGGGTVHWGYRCNACDADLEQAEARGLQSVPDFHKPDCLLSALSHAPSKPAPVVVPSGWKLVPIEPTEAMLVAAENACEELARPDPRKKDFNRMKFIRRHKAMLSASPQPDRESERSYTPHVPGNEQPLPDGTMIFPVFRGDLVPVDAGKCHWGETGQGSDIIGYRLISSNRPQATEEGK